MEIRKICGGIRFFRALCAAVQHSTSILRTPGLCCAMLSALPSNQRWKRTSVPKLAHDKYRDVWRWRLNYTRPKRRPQSCQSQAFKTRAEAEAVLNPGPIGGRRQFPMKEDQRVLGNRCSRYWSVVKSDDQILPTSGTTLCHLHQTTT